MTDLIFLAVVVAFFALAVALMKACEHIIGPDEVATSVTSASTASSPSEPTGTGATPAGVTA